MRLPQLSRAFGKLLLWLTVLLPALQAYPQDLGPEFPNPGNAHMTREKQRALGLQAAAQVYQQMPVVPDSSPETQYIRQLGQKLAATIPAQYSWPFEFHVVSQKEINAFALPGGPMFINVGTIAAAANEAQLAGVMAHEMSHVYMQHAAKQAAKAQTTTLIEGIAGAVVGAAVGGTAGELGQLGIQMTAQGTMLRYSRADESQADAVGAIILYKAGYNPQALADFFKTLESQTRGAPPQWLSDHPNLGNREEAIQHEIRNWPAENYANDSAAFQRVRQHAMGVRAYTGEEIAQGAKSGKWSALNKENGATFNATESGEARGSMPGSVPTSSTKPMAAPLQSVLASQQMLLADLGSVRIRYPENWQVMMPKQRGQPVAIAPQAGITENDVGYGMVLNSIAPPKGAPGSIDDVTRQLVQDMEQNETLQPAGEVQPVRVAGIQGRVVNLQAISPFPAADGQPQKEKDWLVTVPRRDGSVIYMVFVAPQAQFDRFKPVFEAMLKSVQFD